MVNTFALQVSTIGPIPNCDKTAVLGMARTVREMIVLSVRSLELRNINLAAKLYQMDDTVDALYRKYLRELIARQNDVNQRETDVRCYISGLLILRYLERISDHACYISDSIDYILTGRSSPRR